MKQISRITILSLILANALIGICQAASANPIEDDYYDDYGEDEGKSSRLDPTEAGKTVSIAPPYFKKSHLELNAVEGGSVLLDCDVRNFRNDSNAVMWYKGETLISIGKDPVSNRYESLESNSIRIKKVELPDAGDYFCNVLPENIRLHITLKVLDLQTPLPMHTTIPIDRVSLDDIALKVSSGVQILCNGLDFTNKSMTKKQGASFSCECKSSVQGYGQIKWSLNGERAEHIVTKVENGKIYIDNADSDHEGIYQCLGDDKSDKPAIAALAIYVNYEPKVSTHRHHVNAAVNGRAELYCDYKANPIGIVRWKKGNNELSYSEKYSIKNIAHHLRNRTILEIKDINEDDLGEYECHIENSIGANSAKVYLMLEPETPQFEDMEIMGNVVKLHWLVRSQQPLSEAILDYKLSGTYTWSTVSMLSTKQHAHGESMWKITHEMELMPGKWHARVKTRNTVGWSKFSAQHDFSIEDVDDDNEVFSNINKEIPPQDMVMAAGVGLGKTNAASSKTQLRLASFIAVVSIIGAVISLFEKTFTSF